MADGSVIFDTKLDTSGIIKDLAGLASGTLKAGMAGLAALGAYAISVGSDFEQAISNVAATMGTTSDQITEITAKAKELGATTVFSATEAAEGFNILAQSGLSAQEQLSSIESVLNLAAAGSMTLADAAGYVTTTMKAMSIEMDEAGHNANYVADIYAKGATLANTSTAEFGSAMVNAASMAGAYNQTLETTGTALLALAEKGYEGSAAGTYLSRAMSDLYSPTANATKALQELGVSTYDSSGKQRDFIAIINDLNGKFATMTEAEKAAYSATIFTSAGLKAFNSIAGNSADQLEELKANLVDCNGAAEQMAKTKLDNLKGDIIILTSATSVFGEALYEVISMSSEGAGPLRELTQTATDLVNQLTAAITEGGLSGLAASVGDVLAQAITSIFSFVPRFVDTAVQLMRSFVNGISDAAPQLSSIAVEMGTILIDGILSISADLLRLGGELIVSLCNGIASNAGSIIETVASGLGLIASTIVEYLPQITQAGFTLIEALATGLLDAAPALIDTAISLITQLAEHAVETASAFIDTASRIVDALVAALPQIISAIISALPGLIDAIVNGITTLVPKIITCGVNLLSALVKGLPQIIQAIVSKLPEIITSIVGGLLGMLPQIVDCGVELLVALVQALPDIVYQIVAVLPQIIIAIVQTLVGMTAEIVTCGIQLLTSLVAALPQIIVAIVAVLPSIIMAIISALIDNIPLIIQCGIDLLTSLISALPQIITAIVAAMPTIITSIIEALVSNIGMIVQCGIQLFTSLITALPQIITTIIASIPQIITSIVQAILGLRGQLVQAGSNLLQGLADGIGNAIGNVVARAREAAQRVVSSVKSFFGIASPSKLFKNEIGKNLMLGLAGGIDDASSAAVKAAEGVADKIADVDFSANDFSEKAFPTKAIKGFSLDRTVDYSALLETASSIVRAVHQSTGNSAAGGYYGGYDLSGKIDKLQASLEAISDKIKIPDAINANVCIDGKRLSREITPYISSDLDWYGK